MVTASRIESKSFNANQNIAVIGHGIIGLTSALKLLQSGHTVTIYFNADIPDLTTLAFEAYWWPFRIYPQDKVKIWAKSTYDWYKQFYSNPNCGVCLKSHLRFCFDADESEYAMQLFTDWEEIDPSQHGVECKHAYKMRLPSIEPAVFLSHLKEMIVAEGGKFEKKFLSSFTELRDQHAIVINCSGLGARELARDNSVYPVRGQCVCIERPKELDQTTLIYKWANDFASIIPRGTRCVLGGTSQKDDDSREVSQEDTAEIIKKCRKVCSALGTPNVIMGKVGIRPGRPEVRLEVEQLTPDLAVVHNYGHGGGGFTVAWGCAQEVWSIVESLRL